MHRSAGGARRAFDIDGDPESQVLLRQFPICGNITDMEFGELLEAVGREPVFETGLLLAGDVDPAGVRKQLSRWTKAGRLYQLRRGLYALAPPYQKVKPHPFLVANHLVRGSYISLHSALAYRGLIPEAVLVTTSVASRRPSRQETALGVYEYRHIKLGLLFGYRLEELVEDQKAFVATQEKALLDLVHLTPGGDTREYLRELRLQNLDGINPDLLMNHAVRAQSPKLYRAAERIAHMVETDTREYAVL